MLLNLVFSYSSATYPTNGCTIGCTIFPTFLRILLAFFFLIIWFLSASHFSRLPKFIRGCAAHPFQVPLFAPLSMVEPHKHATHTSFSLLRHVSDQHWRIHHGCRTSYVECRTISTTFFLNGMSKNVKELIQHSRVQILSVSLARELFKKVVTGEGMDRISQNFVTIYSFWVTKRGREGRNLAFWSFSRYSSANFTHISQEILASLKWLENINPKSNRDIWLLLADELNFQNRYSWGQEVFEELRILVILCIFLIKKCVLISYTILKIKMFTTHLSYIQILARNPEIFWGGQFCPFSYTVQGDPPGHLKQILGIVAKKESQILPFSHY